MRRLLLIALLGFACAKQDPIPATIEAVADAAEERDAAAVLKHIAPEYGNRAEIENQLRRYFFGYKTIDVTVRDLQAEVSGSTAWATVRVDFIGLPKQVGGFDQFLPRSARYRFDVTLVQHGDAWQIASARWEEEK